MFQELKPLAAKSPIAMQITSEGDQLRVVIQQKRAGKGGVPLSLSIVGAPGELDRELPGAIATAAGELAKPAPVADQVKGQLDAARAAVKEDKPKTEKAAKKARPVKAKSAKPAKTKPLRQASRPKHNAKAAAKIKLPGKPRPAPQKSGRSADGVKHHLSKPGKDACIADYIDSCPKLGDAISREAFIDKKGGTGRRFERLWDMSWNKFKAAAEAARGKASAKPAASPAKTKAAPQEPKGSVGGQTPQEGNRPHPAGAAPTASDIWPFPTTPKDVELKHDKNDTSHGHDVYDMKGKYLSSITSTRPQLGEIIALVSHDGPLKIISIDGVRVMVQPVPATPGKPPAAAGSAVNPAVDGRDVILGRGDATGTVIDKNRKGKFDEGEILDITGYGKVRVIDFDPLAIFVEACNQNLEATA